jgi:hypothetical protein
MTPAQRPALFQPLVNELQFLIDRGFGLDGHIFSPSGVNHLLGLNCKPSARSKM